MTPAVEPIRDDELDGLFGDLAHGPLALAVSGGADSMTLMRLIARWAARPSVKEKWSEWWAQAPESLMRPPTRATTRLSRAARLPVWLRDIRTFADLARAGGPPQIVVLTVDHGLAPHLLGKRSSSQTKRVGSVFHVKSCVGRAETNHRHPGGCPQRSSKPDARRPPRRSWHPGRLVKCCRLSVLIARRRSRPGSRASHGGPSRDVPDASWPRQRHRGIVRYAISRLRQERANAGVSAVLHGMSLAPAVGRTEGPSCRNPARGWPWLGGRPDQRGRSFRAGSRP